MIRKSLLVISCILLLGCVSNTRRMPRYCAACDLEKNAVVILEISNADSLNLIKFDQNFHDDQRKEYKLRGITKLWSLPLGSYRQVVFVAEPGIYFISKAGYVIANTHYRTQDSGLTSTQEIVYGAFEVKAGDVAYIGDLKFNWHTQDHLIDVVNRYEAVANDLCASSKYRDLVHKLKPSKFYAPGSVIQVNANGVAQLSSKHT